MESKKIKRVKRKENIIAAKSRKNRKRDAPKNPKEELSDEATDQERVKRVPRTIENTREPDSTMITDNITSENMMEINRDIDTDELSNYFSKQYEPKVMLTFSEKPIKKSRLFALQLCKVIPNCIRFPRNKMPVKMIIKQAIDKGFTDILIINEDRFTPNGLLLIHLPEGPTAYFRLSNVKTGSRKQCKEMTYHRPEVILNNFTTRLGQTVGRMLGALFHYQPDFKGRRAVTFHNQRDYIFFRHHRYQFIKGQAALRELGPRFTLKLQYLQKGTFDSKYGEYEWTLHGKRHQLETSRRRFFL